MQASVGVSNVKAVGEAQQFTFHAGHISEFDPKQEAAAGGGGAGSLITETAAVVAVAVSGIGKNWCSNSPINFNARNNDEDRSCCCCCCCCRGCVKMARTSTRIICNK